MIILQTQFFPWFWIFHVMYPNTSYLGLCWSNSCPSFSMSHPSFFFCPVVIYVGQNSTKPIYTATRKLLRTPPGLSSAPSRRPCWSHTFHSVVGITIFIVIIPNTRENLKADYGNTRNFPSKHSGLRCTQIDAHKTACCPFGPLCVCNFKEIVFVKSGRFMYI